MPCVQKRKSGACVWVWSVCRSRKEGKISVALTSSGCEADRPTENYAEQRQQRGRKVFAAGGRGEESLKWFTRGSQEDVATSTTSQGQMPVWGRPLHSWLHFDWEVVSMQSAEQSH